MRVTRTAMLVAVVLMALVAMAVPASADITEFTIDEQGKVGQGDAIVRGTIACNADQGSWIVRVSASQENGYFGRGSDKGTCDGTSQRWVVRAAPKEGVNAQPGEAKVCAKALTFTGPTPTDQTINDREQACRTVFLTPA